MNLTTLKSLPSNPSNSVSSTSVNCELKGFWKKTNAEDVKKGGDSDGGDEEEHGDQVGELERQFRNSRDPSRPAPPTQKWSAEYVIPPSFE